MVYPILALRPKKPEEPPYAAVSHALDGHLRAWWAGVRASGKLSCGSLIEGFDYTGDDPDWPELVHIGALAQLAGRSYNKKISKTEMARWLNKAGVEKINKTVKLKNKRGRTIYETTRTFYKIG